MKRIIGIQCRMGSTRLPGKVLKHLGGMTMLERVIRAVENDCDHLSILTTHLEEDEPIVNLCHNLGHSYLRGSPDNVLSRYIELLRYQTDDTLLLRLCADAPFIGRGWCRSAFYMAETIGRSVWIEDFCHVGTRAQWMQCWNEGKPMFKTDTEHAGHGWFSGGVTVRQFVPKGYFTVNTPEDYERARALFDAPSLDWRRMYTTADAFYSINVPTPTPPAGGRALPATDEPPSGSGTPGSPSAQSPG